MKIYGTIFVIFACNKIAKCADYDRSVLQKDYPGFGEDYIIFEGEEGEDVYGYLKFNPHPEARILGVTIESEQLKDIFFTFYSRNLPSGVLIENNTADFTKYFDKFKKTIFITHGWLSSSTADSCVEIRNAYLNTSDMNIFVMDWSVISGNFFYPIPLFATPDVGRHYAKFLNNLVDQMDVDPTDIHLIGHSLGAHVSGFASRAVTKGKVGRITGLDPALPGFSLPGFNDGVVDGGRLNTNDSHFVDIIHTCAGYLGIKDPIGHVDFYPNGGGPPQPGCDLLKFMEACSHGRSWKLYAESVVLEIPYMATNCHSLDLLQGEKCTGDDIPMGKPTPPEARGIYYLKTTGIEPYLWTNNNIDERDLSRL